MFDKIMGRTIVITDDKKNHESRWKRIKAHLKTVNWNILCVKIVGLVAFLIVIMTLIIYNLLHSSEANEDSRSLKIRMHPKQSNAKASNACDFNDNCIEASIKCCIICDKVNISPDTFGKNVDDFYEKNNCKNNFLQIKLINCNFEEDTIQKKWYNSAKPVNFLLIDGNIKNIEDDAFNENAFEKLEKIILQRPNILYYRKNMLRGAKNLVEFGVQDSIPFNVKFEYRFLEEVAKSLKILQLQQCLFHKDAITNVTGTDLVLNQLVTVDFQSNSHLSILPKYGFKLPVLKQLYMDRSGLELIEAYAFSKANNHLLISLTFNNLRTLSKFAFSTDYTKIKLSLANNPWNCTCELFWMKQIEITDIEEIVCSDGNKFKEILHLGCEEYIPTVPIIPTMPTTGSTNFDTTISTNNTTLINNPDDDICLTHNDLLSVILITTFILLFSVLMSNIIQFICIKKHPSLLGRKKRVLFLKKPEDYIVMPVNKSIVPDTIYASRAQHIHACCSHAEDTISYVPVRDVSYFTPVSDRYTYSHQKPTLRRSVSDLSGNTVASYVTESQLECWEKDKMSRNYSCHFHQETPPAPLPRNSCTRQLDNGIQVYRC